MWPFNILKQRSYKKRYNAAMVVHLGQYAFRRLDTCAQVQIDTEVDANFNRSDTPAAAWRQFMDNDNLSVVRAAAMERLGYDSPIEELPWSQLFEPWRSRREVPYFGGLGPYDSRPDAILFDYRFFDPATVDAKQLLATKGIDGSETRNANQRQPKRPQ